MGQVIRDDWPEVKRNLDILRETFGAENVTDDNSAKLFGIIPQQVSNGFDARPGTMYFDPTFECLSPGDTFHRNGCDWLYLFTIPSTTKGIHIAGRIE